MVNAQGRGRGWVDAVIYARRIRNKPKRLYAERYAAWRFGQVGGEPDWRERAPLSFMGAQAVRHRLETIFDATVVPSEAP